MVLYDIARALERVENGQKEILDRLAALEKKAADGPGNAPKSGDRIQQGIDNILNYQAGQKRGDEQ